MPKAKNAKADEALALYRQGLKLIDIAKRLDLPEGTIRRWKCKYKWDGEQSERFESERSETQEANVFSHGVHPKNRHAEKYGFLSKHLPAETMELFNVTVDSDPLDLLWVQIQIAYAAIIRAQKIAFVRNAEDKTIEKTMSGSTMGFEIQQAWDKQANFMKAQARAQSELRSMIKQYDEMLHKDWESVSEEQKLRLQLMRMQVSDGGGSADKVVIVNDTNGPHQ